METKYELWVRVKAKLNSIEKQVLDNLDFQGASAFLQFWGCYEGGKLKGVGRYLFLTYQSRFSGIHDDRLKDYRRTCLNNNHRYVGSDKIERNWFAGHAVQTRVADYQHDGEASGMGQLVVPVFRRGAVRNLLGIIELVTAQHNETYAADFNRIQSSLMELNLTSTYLGKEISVEYNQYEIKFPLPFSAKLQDLHKEVTMRFNKLKNKAFCIAYRDLNNHLISNDSDLQFCITESISNRKAVIKMVIEDVAK